MGSLFFVVEDLKLLNFHIFAQLFLQEDPFIKRYEEEDVDVATYVTSVHDQILQLSPSPSSCSEQPLS